MRAAPRKIYSGHGEVVGRFGREWIVQTKGKWAGRPLPPEPWQQDFLDELFLVYEDGEWVYREALLGVARKNGKSTLCALLGLYLLLASGEQGPEVYVAAASERQARIVFQQAVEFVRASPRLRDWLTPQRNAILCRENNGIFRVLSSDAPLQYGLNPSGVIIDELWAHANPELYYALTTGQLARDNPLSISITTAGWDRESICFEQYMRGKRLLEEGGVEAMRRAGFLFRWYEAPVGADHKDEASWRAANPSSWIRGEVLQREAERLPENVFRRLHLNQWTETEDAWIKAHQWDACRGRPVFNPLKPSYMALDVGIRRDSAVVTWGQWQGEELHVGQRVMTPERMGPTFGVADVRGYVAQEAQRHNRLREVAYDPWSFRESAEILQERGIPMVEFPQNSARMSPASETLYELILNRRIVHDGDQEMKEQILAAVVAPTERGGWRVSKRKSLERIDGCVSLVVLADRAVTLRYERPPQLAVVME